MAAALARRGYDTDTLERLRELDDRRRALISQVDTARAEQGTASKAIGRAAAEERPELIDRAAELKRRGLEDPNPHGDLWAWYGRWSAGDMPSWASRRTHLTEMYQGLIDQIRNGPDATGAQLYQEPTGWPRVDRGIYELRRRLEQAETEEQFQAVGLLCRETLVSVAQVVYDPERHRTDDTTQVSDTDAKRMLEAYIAVELGGSVNEGVRRHAKAALTLANDLQHHRTATYRQAALCAEATTSVVNLVAIMAGRRDPQR